MVYLLRMCNGKIYVGASTDLEQRLSDHYSGKACATTKRYAPTELLRVEVFANFSEARKRERQIKRWSLAKKEALVLNDTTTLKLLSKSR